MSKNNNYDLFNNPMVNAARASMTKEQLDDYQKQGEYMFEMMDVTNDPLVELTNQVEDTLQGGLHPSYLDSSERLVMENKYGNEWFKTFGWDKLEMD
jgi:hypothetical protein